MSTEPMDLSAVAFPDMRPPLSPEAMMGALHVFAHELARLTPETECCKLQVAVSTVLGQPRLHLLVIVMEAKPQPTLRLQGSLDWGIVLSPRFADELRYMARAAARLIQEYRAGYSPYDHRVLDPIKRQAREER